MTQQDKSPFLPLKRSILYFPKTFPDLKSLSYNCIQAPCVNLHHCYHCFLSSHLSIQSLQYNTWNRHHQHNHYEHHPPLPDLFSVKMTMWLTWAGPQTGILEPCMQCCHSQGKKSSDISYAHMKVCSPSLHPRTLLVDHCWGSVPLASASAGELWTKFIMQTLKCRLQNGCRLPLQQLMYPLTPLYVSLVQYRTSTRKKKKKEDQNIHKHTS